MIKGEKVGRFFKLFLIWGLVFQLSFGLTFLYAEDEKGPSAEEILGNTYREAPWPLSVLADELPAIAKSAEVRADVARLEEGLDAIEEGRTSDLPLEQRDVFHLGGQSFELLHKGKVTQTFDLGQLNIELPYIAYDSLRVKMEDRDLVFEAINAGDVVARHIIPNIYPLATAMDKELLYVFDRQGRIHATDMAFARTQGLFRTPLPWFKNLWIPLKPLDLNGEVKLTFLTRGLAPFPEMNPGHPQHAQVVLPRERVQGRDEIIYSAGDLVVSKEDGSGRRLLGVFSRAVTHMQIARAKVILAWLGMIANPSEVPKETLQELIGLMDAEEGSGDLAAIQGTMTPVARRAFSAFGREAVEALIARSKKNKVLQGRVVDQMTLESWAQSFERLRERAQAISDIEGGSGKEAAQLKAQLEAQDLGGSWQALSNPEIVGKKMRASQEGWVHRLSGLIPSPKTLKILGGIAAGSAAVAGGYAADIVPIVYTLNYAWANWVPSVLKDAQYRYPLMMSVVSLLAFIPLCSFIGIASVPVMNRLSSLIGKLPGARARKISLWLEARVNVWEPMTTWQRNVSIGMRYYGRICLPAFHWMSDRVLRQPNFLAALRAKLNPLSRDPNHPTAGVMGVNSPLADQRTLYDKRQALSDLALHQNRADSMARLLALLTVSEETDVDPATILAVLSGQVAPGDVNKILEDPVRKRQWDLTTEAISRSIGTLSPQEARDLLEKADPQVLGQMYEEAKMVAEEIRSQSRVIQVLVDLKNRFIRAVKRIFSALANFGVRDYELLVRGYAAPDIAEQVRKEFTSDHVVVVGYPSFWGPRADLSDPKNLAADPSGTLWSSPGHLYDLVVNTWLHFFHSGARQMLVYYTRPDVVETHYDPEANSALDIADRQEGLLAGFGHWFQSLLDFRKSDLGGIFQKNWIRQITTFQAGLVLCLVTRILIAEQNPEEALRGWWLTLTGSTIYIGWAWYVLQAGNYTDNPRIGDRVEKLKDHLVSIRQGLELGDQKRLSAGRQGILDFYREARVSPEEIAELEALSDAALVERTVTDPPFATKPHGWVQWSAVWFTVFITTYLGVVLTVNSLDNDHLSNANLLRWTGYWIGFSQGMWLLTSKTSWDFLHTKFGQVKTFLDTRLLACEDFLER